MLLSVESFEMVVHPQIHNLMQKACRAHSLIFPSRSSPVVCVTLDSPKIIKSLFGNKEKNPLKTYKLFARNSNKTFMSYYALNIHCEDMSKVAYHEKAYITKEFPVTPTAPITKTKKATM